MEYLSPRGNSERSPNAIVLKIQSVFQEENGMGHENWTVKKTEVKKLKFYICISLSIFIIHMTIFTDFVMLFLRLENNRAKSRFS